MKKPIKISSNSFVVDSNFNVLTFTEQQVKSYAKKVCKELSKRIGYQLKVTGVKDCGNYFIYTMI